jgi:hypothetical protein
VRPPGRNLPREEAVAVPADLDEELERRCPLCLWDKARPQYFPVSRRLPMVIASGKLKMYFPPQGER